MTFLQYFEYHSSLRQDFKQFYVAFKELKEHTDQIRTLVRDAARTIGKTEADLDNANLLRQITATKPSVVQDYGSINVGTLDVEPTNESVTVQLTTVDEEIQNAINYFFQALRQDVDQLNKFYVKKVKEMSETLVNLSKEVSQVKSERISPMGRDKSTELKSDFQFFYRNLEFFFSFVKLNQLGIRELSRHFEKATGQANSTLLNQYASKEPYCQIETITELMDKVEILYTSYFDHLDHEKALNELREQTTQHSHKDTFKLAFNVGFMFGGFVLLIILFFFPLFTYTEMEESGFSVVFPIFRGLFLFLLYVWLWGFNLYVWHMNRINHVYIFEIDPNKNLNYVKVLKTASYLSVIWLIFFLLFLLDCRGVEHPLSKLLDKKWYAFGAIFTIVGAACAPFHVFHLSARTKVLKILGTLLITPFGKAGFAECFVADVLTSMVIPITDTMYIMCYISVQFASSTSENRCAAFNKYGGPMLAFVPYLWRFGQCIRRLYDTRDRDHIFNSLKYCASMLVILLNALHVNRDGVGEGEWGFWRYAWIVTVIFSTCFSYTWDLLKDWGFMQCSSKHVLLRDRILYEPKWHYYAVMVFNLITRFAWAATLSSLFYPHLMFLKVLFGALELMRRAIWSIYRVEWAIVSNVENFRKHKYVPLHFEPSLEKRE